MFPVQLGYFSYTGITDIQLVGLSSALPIIEAVQLNPL